MSWNPKYVLLLMASTLITYLSGIMLSSLKEKGESDGKRKAVVCASLVLNLLMLVYFKYTAFLLTSFNRILGIFSPGNHIDTDWALSIVLPVGISFFIFQALSYTIDVYRGTVEAEKNLVNYALFVSFFPQLVAGPIERSGNLLSQIKAITEKKLYSYEGLIRGLILMAWGFFMKVAVADRMSMITDPIFNNYQQYGSTVLLVGILTFNVQVYCDFAGYSTIAIGAASVMGIKLMENFNTPLLSRNVGEFWVRWHISLGTWFRDYVYFPLGGSRCSKLRGYFNLMVTFLVSGLWHGAAAKYVVWGGAQGLLQVLSRMFKPLRARICKVLKIKDGPIISCLQVIYFNVMFSFVLIMFRTDSLKDAYRYFINIFKLHDFTQFIAERKMNEVVSDRDMVITLIAVLILLLVDLIKRLKGKYIDDILVNAIYPVRAAVLMAVIFFVILFGQYGSDVYTQPFVYFQF